MIGWIILIMIGFLMSIIAIWIKEDQDIHKKQRKIQRQKGEAQRQINKVVLPLDVIVEFQNKVNQCEEITAHEVNQDNIKPVKLTKLEYNGKIYYFKHIGYDSLFYEGDYFKDECCKYNQIIMVNYLSYNLNIYNRAYSYKPENVHTSLEEAKKEAVRYFKKTLIPIKQKVNYDTEKNFVCN